MDQAKSKKKKLKIGFVIIGGILLLLVLTAAVLSAVSSRLKNDTLSEDALPDSAFYEPDYTKDILSDDAYLRLDRSILYMEYSSGMTLTEDNYRTAGVASEFFYDYFRSIISGDATAYRSMLTDNFISKNEPPTRFTMQPLYNISVNQVQECSAASYQGTEVRTYYFSVTYSIFRNDGTFQRAVASNKPLTQFYELYLVDGKFLLNAIIKRNIVNAS